MTIVVHQIICEFQLIEGNNLFHPLSTLGWGVGVDVDPPGHEWIRLARYNPAGIVEWIPGNKSRQEVCRNHYRDYGAKRLGFSFQDRFNFCMSHLSHNIGQRSKTTAYSYTVSISPFFFFSFDREEQPFNLNNGKFSFTIRCVPLVWLGG